MGAIGQSEFLDLLAAEFPEVAAEVREAGQGLLHLEAAVFRGATERAMDTGQLWVAERHFRFVERVLSKAAPDVENALEVSYIEDLALGECTPQRYRAVKGRMPAKLRADMARIHLSPRSGRAEVATTLRLAQSQTVAAVVAHSDGRYTVATAPIVVTLSACIDAHTARADTTTRTPLRTRTTRTGTCMAVTAGICLTTEPLANIFVR